MKIHDLLTDKYIERKPCTCKECENRRNFELLDALHRCYGKDSHAKQSRLVR